MTPLDTALSYIARGWSPVPVPHREKGPTRPGWQGLRLTAETAGEFFSGPRHNIGIVLGGASDGLVDTDLDCAEAVRLGPCYLPHTRSTFGRAGSRGSHRLYKADGIKRAQFSDPATGELMLEVRGEGHQTVFPGSTHPSGEAVEWEQDGEPPAVEADALLAAAGRLAAATMLVRAAPAKGRHDYLLAGANALARSLEPIEAKRFLIPVAEEVLDDRRDRAAGEVARMIDRARELRERDEPVTGWPHLREVLGDKRTASLGKWLGLTQPREGEGGDGERPDTSHDALALAMGQEWTDDARHVALWGRWLFWNGAKWENDERLVHMTRTRDYLRRVAARVPAERMRLREAKTIASVVGLARSNAELAAGTAQWDSDRWTLNTPAGLVDLRTGELLPPDPLAYCTKATAVAPVPAGTKAPMWEAFLARIFRHDPTLVPYMQRVLGYALTGETSEHVLIFAWGQGANGKGTLFNTAARVMGEYAAVAPADMLLVTNSDRHPCDMAMMRGARLVTAQELAPGRAWDEPKLKSLTGGDDITARFMRQDFFTYTPQFTLVAAGNHKPSFKGVDEAIRRRVQLVPFLQNIPPQERDKNLPEKLRDEWPAILRWMIDGCLAWQREGLNPPESVRQASEDYLAAEDVLGQWIEERCVVGPQVKFTPVGDLYDNWCAWCEGGRLPTGSMKLFSQVLSERGFERTKQRGVMALRGIRLRNDDDDPPGKGKEDAAPKSEDAPPARPDERRGEDGEGRQIWGALCAHARDTAYMSENSPSSPRQPEMSLDGGGGEGGRGSDAPPRRPSAPRRKAGVEPELFDRDDLEAWRRRLAAAPHKRAKRELVLAWVAAWGGGADGYGNPELPDDLPENEATAALRSACAYYWRPE